jgi:hypothetical protein
MAAPGPRMGTVVEFQPSFSVRDGAKNFYGQGPRAKNFFGRGSRPIFFLLFFYYFLFFYFLIEGDYSLYRPSLNLPLVTC